jgi:hypothetical protein
MEGLGYSKNREPFLRLARAVTLRNILALGVPSNREELQALLLGAAGLLPSSRTVHDKESRAYLRQLVRLWRSQRRNYRSSVLHAADWQLFPTRPANFPTVRITAACQLIDRILRADLFRSLMETLKEQADGTTTLGSIRASLRVTPDPFWSHHYRFTPPTKRALQPLGEHRMDELIANTIVPLALLYARIFKDPAIRRGALQLFDSLPSPGENSITRCVREQLLRGNIEITSAAFQQGVLQLYKFYCSEERCGECEIGEVLFGKAT